MSKADDLLNSLDEALVEIDHDLNILYHNLKAAQILPLKEVNALSPQVGRSIAEFLPRQAVKAFKQAIQKRETTFRSFFSEHVQKWVFFSAKPLRHSLLITLYDHDKASEEIRNSSDLLQAVFNASTLPITVFSSVRNEVGEIVDFEYIIENVIAERLWENGRMGERLLALHPGVKSNGIFDLYKRVVETAEPLDKELHFEGNVLNGWYRLTAVKFDDSVVTTVENISERKETEYSMRKSLHILTQSEAIAKMGSWEYDIEKKIWSWSAGMYNIFGVIEGTEVFPDKYLNLIVPEQRDIAKRIINSIKSSWESFDEIVDIEVGGRLKIIHLKGFPLFKTDGTVEKMIGIDMDITEMKLTENELKDQNFFVQQITQATPDIISIFDLEKRSYIYINKELYPILGYTSKQIQEMDFLDSRKLICPEDLPLIEKYLESFQENDNEDVREVEFRVKSIQGHWWWVKARGKMFKKNAQGQVTQIISIIQDFSLKKDAEEKKRENEFMQALLLKKDEFMSVASHELKTPITTIKASLQILQRQVEKQVDESVLLVFIKRAILQINKLSTLIGDLMDNTKIQSGKLKLNISLCTMDEIIADSILHGFNVQNIIVENMVTEPVEVDRIRIEQVLTNYISNAIKYSPGSDKILLKVNKEGDSVKVSVRDFGIGIAKEKTPYVFDRFFRVNEASTQFSGLGLGLYISAEIINLHHGKYGVESEEGQGSTFWFSVPFKQQVTHELTA